MDIEEVLMSQHLELKRTTKWITVNDLRPTFRKAFPRMRFGKLMGSQLYVTLPAIAQECESLIVAAGQHLDRLSSTDGSNRSYPGFETAGVPKVVLENMVRALLLAVDDQIKIVK